jgi:hypothetical protein
MPKKETSVDLIAFQRSPKYGTMRRSAVVRIPGAASQTAGTLLIGRLALRPGEYWRASVKEASKKRLSREASREAPVWACCGHEITPEIAQSRALCL